MKIDSDQEISTYPNEAKIDTTEKIFEIEENNLDDIDGENDDYNFNIPDDYAYYDNDDYQQQEEEVATTDMPAEEFNPMNEICNQFSGCILYIRNVENILACFEIICFSSNNY